MQNGAVLDEDLLKQLKELVAHAAENTVEAENRVAIEGEDGGKGPIGDVGPNRNVCESCRRCYYHFSDIRLKILITEI